MATLHARNFPDDLYARLRAAAEEDGRSIGAQAAVLVRTALRERDQRKRDVQKMRPRPPTFREQFVMRAEQLVLRAQDLCREVGSPEVKN